MQQKIDFAKFIFCKIYDDESCVRKILQLYEADFSLSGQVNIQNCRIWGSSNPSALPTATFSGITAEFII